MRLTPYERKAQYYETDQMGIIHHSNYIRWLEEARIDLMDQMKAAYKSLEEMGITIPVLSVSCSYKSMVRFGDTVLIRVKITEYTGTRLGLSYKITDKVNGALRTTGETTHCFLGDGGRPLSLRRAAPYFDEQFRTAMAFTE